VKVLNKKFETNDFGCFYFNNTEVNKVHLALSLVIVVTKDLISEAEKEIITRSQWLSPNDLRMQLDNNDLELENWSELVFNLIEAKINN
jgi:predicted NUDIX family phosphoesterase